MHVYSTAVFNCISRTAIEFCNAIACDDHERVNRLLDQLRELCKPFLPHLNIHNGKPGHAVSIIKADARRQPAARHKTMKTWPRRSGARVHNE